MAELTVAVRLDAMQMPLKRALQTAARLGATAIELDARNAVKPGEMTDTGLRQLRKLLDDYNLRVAALRFQTRRGYDNLQDLDRRVDATKSAMRLAYKLGSPVVVNQLGLVPESTEDARWSSFQSVIEDLGRYGARVGAFLAAETGAESGETLAAFLGDSEDAFIAVALNPGQLIINRHSVPDAITALKDRVVLVYAVDGVLDLAAGRGISVPLGQGTADFPQLIGMLEDIQYRGAFVVGRPDSTLDELQQGIEYLRNL
ncbi:MAG: sugar phosphate isomerase/epimerase [Pirellulaceae bacterium]|nr:sugar phosphate isomerase/epimerase [Pirellulaceae bacterium]